MSKQKMQAQNVQCEGRLGSKNIVRFPTNYSDISCVYIFKIRGQDRFKIGRSDEPVSRISNIQTSSPLKVDPVYYCETNVASELESFLHNRYDADRLIGEWFELSNEQVSDAISIMRLAESECVHPPAPRTAGAPDLSTVIEQLKSKGVACPECGEITTRYPKPEPNGKGNISARCPNKNGHKNGKAKGFSWNIVDAANQLMNQ